MENWAKETIIHPKKQGQVLFIQGGPGRGKSVFCRMFADWVRQQLYPIWIPVLIRLRDIPKLQNSFRETLREAVNANFASDDGWLTDRNTRYLFFLDGFDELIIEGRNSSGLEQFLRQVGQFQKDSTGKDMGHRVIVTGRTLALQGVERQMPDNLERVRIEVMDEPLQQQWLSLWEKQVGTEKKNAFGEFLQDEGCPEQVQELAREPLLLYLLAAMHRDDKLNLEAFEETNETQAKLVIYETSLNWVLTEQRKPVQTHITGLETEDLRDILMEAGLCVVQSGGEYAKVQMIEERLDQDIVAAIEQARTQAGENVLKNALAAFYLKPAAGDKDGGVEFFHKSFSEFLCAKRLQESLIAWTEPGRRGRGYNLKDEQLWEEIYDFLGYGGLTPEIVEYLMGLLRESKEFRPVQLFERLEDFYFRWSYGEFIDSSAETLPQRKCRQLQKQGIELGQRQVDVYTGLNVMILLFELHRYGQRPQNSRPPNPQNWGLREVGDFESDSPQNWGARGALLFHPCGQLNVEGKPEDQFRLYRIMGYSRCVGEFCFVQKVGQFLKGTNLTGADLKRTDLRGANLKDTDLRNANLRGTYLRDTELDSADLSGTYLSNANLRSANLSGADLSGADLSGADLSNTNLTGANLTSTNLSNANLSRADLRGANFSGGNLTRADLSDANLSDTNLIGAYQASQKFGDIQWDENTNWENVRGLETAMNVPEALKRQLGLE